MLFPFVGKNKGDAPGYDGKRPSDKTPAPEIPISWLSGRSTFSIHLQLQSAPLESPLCGVLGCCCSWQHPTGLESSVGRIRPGHYNPVESTHGGRIMDDRNRDCSRRDVIACWNKRRRVLLWCFAVAVALGLGGKYFFAQDSIWPVLLCPPFVVAFVVVGCVFSRCPACNRIIRPSRYCEQCGVQLFEEPKP